MARISESTFGNTPFQRLLGHNEKVMEGWSYLGDVLEKDGFLSSELKEQVRRTLAQSNGCEYCKAKGKPEPEKFNEKISIAVGFAEVFLKQKESIPDSSFEILQEYFNENEISELCAFIAFTTASQYFGAMMKLEAENKIVE
ncbi:carboxymuconolactone decarboxylase family protein [Heyndrickxia oleronia]|jgi:alkylhydroperoxidase family enzyme|uniref:Alkylhydroperoxidase n=1 Tax=Heyndrickxia oleronia TaxID=38875 RepID=A0A8E2LGS4_9BACI|nr:carboxymuconolactone decarboxylase family protein [Heyndrickxia oleronia]NYV65646.1 carboxymuconolactone decarboxylase family protein [Bacillus sp. Gen3]MCM3454985.1 carboxymuconolactone decarboxylase family protein [Heyndrickxia oleronia]MEC1375941.1 carboxymuconolactone decarboxylase family protein [Heyndrickxia oleronia]OOP69439.1 alkylhydroperoxidase [Heyndrickxia oleronia]QQZ05648.1 carboxymuconolactone decarboxylase family protein [Heyndrickxia oleronia]